MTSGRLTKAGRRLGDSNEHETHFPALRSCKPWNAAHYLHPFNRPKELGGAWARASSSVRRRCTCGNSEGNQILDGMAGLWLREHRLRPERELADVAYKQMLGACRTTTASPVRQSTRRSSWLQRIARSQPAHMMHVFFTGCGSESNDTRCCVWCGPLTLGLKANQPRKPSSARSRLSRLHRRRAPAWAHVGDAMRQKKKR